MADKGNGRDEMDIANPPHEVSMSFISLYNFKLSQVMKSHPTRNLCVQKGGSTGIDKPMAEDMYYHPWSHVKNLEIVNLVLLVTMSCPI